VDLTTVLTGAKGGFLEHQDTTFVQFDDRNLAYQSMSVKGAKCSVVAVSGEGAAGPLMTRSVGCGLPGGDNAPDPLTITWHFKVVSTSTPGSVTGIYSGAQYMRVNRQTQALLPIDAQGPTGVVCPRGDVKIGASFCTPVVDVFSIFGPSWFGTAWSLPTYIDDVKKGLLFPKMTTQQRTAYIAELERQDLEAIAQGVAGGGKGKANLFTLFVYVLTKTIADSTQHAT
jgi:hypothetical protein